MKRDEDGEGTDSPEGLDGSEDDRGRVPNIKDAKMNGARRTGVWNDREEGNPTMGLAKYSTEGGGDKKRRREDDGEQRRGHRLRVWLVL